MYAKTFADGSGHGLSLVVVVHFDVQIGDETRVALHHFLYRSQGGIGTGIVKICQPIRENPYYAQHQDTTFRGGDAQAVTNAHVHFIGQTIAQNHPIVDAQQVNQFPGVHLTGQGKQFPLLFDINAL